MKKTINRTHVSGLLYEHDLQLRTTGPNSKKPGTTFIMGTVSIIILLRFLMILLAVSI